eukprot:TRINITY_DN9723_c0_g2_i1.p1 TRINITY_DN9723_c0_g2~~TRINITY_DN9723_c0_g2_i1.p1  ORF type:complete len:675 (-),score=102.90 TRINITY_DN9723_c0_g2_i1:1133-3157(-)
MTRLQRMASDAASYAIFGHGSGGLLRTSSISSKKTAPNRVCCNALLAAYARAKPPQWKRALKLLELMWECGLEVTPDIVSYNTVMKACSNATQLETALQVYCLMKQRGLEPSVATYGTLISAASEAKAYDIVMRVWEALSASGLESNTTCMNALILALEQKDRWDESQMYFNNMLQPNAKVQPNAHTFNTVMCACVRRKEPQKVKELFNTMFAMNVQPTVQSYNTLLSAYALTGQWKEALELLKFISRSDVNVRPTIDSYNHVLTAVLNFSTEASEEEKDKLAVTALQVLEQAKTTSGCEIDVGTFNIAIAVMNATGKYAQCLQAYEQMVASDVKPDAATASAVLKACSEGSEQGLWEISIALFNKLKSVRIEPDSVVYNVSVTVCAKSGAWQQALQIFSEMMTGNFSVDPITLQTIMKGLRDAHEWDILRELFLIMRENKAALNTNIFNMVLSAYEICGDYDKGTEVLRQLLQAGLAPDHATLNSLIRLLTKSAANLSKALETFDWMEEGCGEYQLYPTQETYLIMIEGLTNHRQFTKAIKISMQGHEKEILKFYFNPKDNLNEISTIQLAELTPKLAIIFLHAWIQKIISMKNQQNKRLGVDKLSICCSGETTKNAVEAALQGKAAEVLECGSEKNVDVFITTEVVYELAGLNEFIFSIECNNFYKWVATNK